MVFLWQVIQNAIFFYQLTKYRQPHKLFLAKGTVARFIKTDAKRLVWRKLGNSRHLGNAIPTVKHGGGSIMCGGIFQQ